MDFQRFNDDITDQYSYIVSDHGDAIVVDPGRRVTPYLDYLRDNNLVLRGIVLTHLPASFASGWAELRQLSGAELIAGFDAHFHGEGQFTRAGRATMIPFGEGCHLQTQLTPGFSPYSICLLALDADGKTRGIFTGGALLHQGVAYPLPRPDDKNPLHNEKTYAKEQYESIHGLLDGFDDRATVYTGFGPESHYAKMQEDNQGRFNLTEARDENPVYERKTPASFADWLTEDYPHTPAYVLHCLAHNKEGFPAWHEALAPFREFVDDEHRKELTAPGRSVLQRRERVVEQRDNVVIIEEETTAVPTTPADTGAMAPAAAPKEPKLTLGQDVLLIDTRPTDRFNEGHAPGAINVRTDGNFALWLGSIVEPGEPMHILVHDEAGAYRVAESIAKIGYDNYVMGVSHYEQDPREVRAPELDVDDFREHHIGKYTIVDVRPPRIAVEDTRFYGALNYPLWELRKRWKEIPQDRPVVVHCGGGYHSAMGASILRRHLSPGTVVYDLGDRIKNFERDRDLK